MDVLEETLRGLSIARRTRPDSPTYLLDAALPLSGPPSGPLAVSCSDFTIHLHNRDTLIPVGDFQGHRGPLCGLVFSPSSPDCLFSGSSDGTVRRWDARCPGSKATAVFQSDASHRYSSLDVSCDGALLCAGTEQVEDEDSFLVFWDVRKPGAVLGVYSESHSDDITQVRFHPRQKDRMASGSTDGLVNVFDLSRGSEEEALLATCNSHSSAGAVCWCGADYAQLLCLSHDEGLNLWDLGQLETDQPLTVFSTDDARGLKLLADGGGVDYLVGARWLEECQQLMVVAGNNGGDLHLLGCGPRGLRLLRTLQGGHTATVRCFAWDAAKDALVTGGEDAQLLLWKPGGEELSPGKAESMKSESALRLKSRPHKKHGYKREKNKNTK